MIRPLRQGVRYLKIIPIYIDQVQDLIIPSPSFEQRMGNVQLVRNLSHGVQDDVLDGLFEKTRYLLFDFST